MALNARVFDGRVYEDGRVAITARITDLDPPQTPLVQADFTTITYRVVDTKTLVQTDSGSITISAAVFNTLQTDWVGSTTGYNFHEVFPATGFPEPGREYKLYIDYVLSSGGAPAGTLGVFGLRTEETGRL